MLIPLRCGSWSETPPMASLGLEREDEQPLLLELVAQPGFAVGDVDAFDDFPVGRCEPAAELHSTLNASVA